MRNPPRRRTRDRGQTAIEYLGFLPVLLIVGLAGLQLGIVAYAAQQAGTGARAAARAAGADDEDVSANPEAVGYAAMSGWIASRATVDEDGGVATVRVTIPSVVPFWSFEPVEKTATMPVPQTPSEDDE
ncbi:TadE/TadG family type IV pilus assembly protein [Streptomyces sp. NPDC015130]|uniref:TadE/TadG family type IV pilus assembly protein n=1 Tax=Streptomyces sp. NPDC015130 TaxID=3364940 RepID=UPI0036FB3211